ncbi:phage major capsid protein [Paludisphaera borealis]|uniref:Phage capsid-like C-terminal domain-containing protein n=1 Tax=Paludisphaera borealis TaxID=1387353 RepID=A0A1U7CX52_9BACT|nr:phage major capsid protein [Paludisphaera borealis]APW63532.1 hypothetical protein BSF38_05104 [Paludisphaera borealis]
MTGLDFRQTAKLKHDEAQAIIQKADAEKRSMSTEELSSARGLLDEVKALQSEADVRERFSSVAAGGFAAMPHHDAKNVGKHTYKRSRVVQAMAAGKAVDGLEGEIHQTYSQLNRNLPFPEGGIYMPWDAVVERHAAPAVVTPSMTTGTSDGAIFTNYDTDIIDMLRPLTVLGQAGATFKTNLPNGKYHTPKKNVKTAAYWVPEGSAPNKSGTGYTSVILDGKHLAANATVSYESMKKAEAGQEADLVKDLFGEMFLEMENATFNGTGADGIPRGLLASTGTNIVEFKTGSGGGNATLAKILEFEKQIAIKNVRGPLSWITTPHARSYLKQLPKLSGSQYADFFWAGDNTICGYPALMSNMVPANNQDTTDSNLSSIILGCWQHLMIGIWGGVYLIRDDKSSFGSGAVNFGVHQMVDVALRYPEAFSISNDLKVV